MSTKRPLDRFYKKAKLEGHVARSIYKLKELNEKYRLFKQGHTVLDVGAAPGSWMRYVSECVGESGLVVGVDQNVLKEKLQRNMRFIQADLFSLKVETFHEFREKYDAVVSDVAPQTSGNRDRDHIRSIELCEKTWEIAKALLKPGGNFVCKMYQGPESTEFSRKVEKHFHSAKFQKPVSTRRESREVYFVALQYSLSR